MDDDGRVTAVLLHAQHSFEMLLKAALQARGVTVFDARTGKSIGLSKCLNIGTEKLGLSSEDAGTIRALDAMRDDEQHYLGSYDEGILYLHLRAAVTIFGKLLVSVFNETLADHLPERVLPISTVPPDTIDILIDRQYTQVQQLLAPGQRHRPEARQKIRSLLALEAHAVDEVGVSEKDVNRVERAVKQGKTRSDVFPRLENLTSVAAGSGVNVTVSFSKREGIPVRYIGADDPTEAAAVRQVDLSRKYHLGRAELASKCGLTTTKAKRLRDQLGLDADPDCCHVFEHGRSRFPSYSDNAVTKMKDALDNQDPANEGTQHGDTGGPRS